MGAGRGVDLGKRHAGLDGWGRGGAEGNGEEVVEEGVVDVGRDHPGAVDAAAPGAPVSLVDTSRECACAVWLGPLATLGLVTAAAVAATAMFLAKNRLLMSTALNCFGRASVGAMAYYPSQVRQGLPSIQLR